MSDNRVHTLPVLLGKALLRSAILGGIAFSYFFFGPMLMKTSSKVHWTSFDLTPFIFFGALFVFLLWQVPKALELKPAPQALYYTAIVVAATPVGILLFNIFR